MRPTPSLSRTCRPLIARMPLIWLIPFFTIRTSWSMAWVSDRSRFQGRGQSCEIGIGRLGLEVGLMLGIVCEVGPAQERNHRARHRALGLRLAATTKPHPVQFHPVLCTASIRLEKGPVRDKKPALGLDQLPWPASQPPAPDPNMAVRQFPEAWNRQGNPESGTQQPATDSTTF